MHIAHALHLGIWAIAMLEDALAYNHLPALACIGSGAEEVGPKQGGGRPPRKKKKPPRNGRRKMLMTTAKSLVLITTEGDHRNNPSKYIAMQQQAREREREEMQCNALLFCAPPGSGSDYQSLCNYQAGECNILVQSGFLVRRQV